MSSDVDADFVKAMEDVLTLYEEAQRLWQRLEVHETRHSCQLARVVADIEISIFERG